ncbi:MAG TPA: hypothetical protein VD763_10005 [Candidatus Saccharimonadales bacterium]|nr:hypothetical protein [Candidatus Saccharimonadales bacterium]
MADATMILNADGTAADASEEALAMLGVSLDQLRSLPAGAFSPEPPDAAAEAAFREAWEEQGSPDIGGEGTLRRFDGSHVRVRFAIAPTTDGRFRAIFEAADGAVAEPPMVYTAGQVLARWRAAERELTTLAPGSPDHERVQADIDGFRTRYQEFFRPTDRPTG